MSRNIKHLDFEIEKEYWNRYRLHEDAELRMRLILTNVLKRITNAHPVDSDYAGEGTSIITIMPKDGYQLYGLPPTSPYSPDDISNAQKIGIEFDPIDEPWNLYRAEGFPVKTKLVVSSVYRLIDRYDMSGVPMYVANSTVLFNIRTNIS